LGRPVQRPSAMNRGVARDRMRTIANLGLRLSETLWASGANVLQTIVAAFVMIVLCAATSVSQSPATVTIQGRVLDPAGAPLNAARVFLEHAGARMAETSTNAGSFTFGGLQPGDYTLTAEVAGQHGVPVPVHANQPGLHQVQLTIGDGSGPQKAAD